MDPRERLLKIEAIEVAIPILQQQELRMQAILSSESSSPEIKAQARGDLAKAIKDLAEAAEEISRLRAYP